MSSSTDIEKKNLEAHVELCAERYNSLEQKLDSMDKRLNAVEEHLIAIRDSITNKSNSSDKQLIAIFTSVVGVLIAGIITLLVNYLK